MATAAMTSLLRGGCTAVAFAALYACSSAGSSRAVPEGSLASGETGEPRSHDGSGDASAPTGAPPSSDAGGGDGSSPEAAPAPPPEPKVNTTTETVVVDGRSRTYVLSVPRTYEAGRSYPLVLALHGDGQDASSFRSFLGLEAFSAGDAIVAYPEQSVDLFTPYARNNDQRLIEEIVVAAKAKLPVDASKIWGIGYSKGGYQLNEIACRKPGLLTAMAIHAGGAPQERNASGDVDCPLATALPVFVTHGQNDVPAGGEFAADYWASVAGCGSSRTASSPPICEAYSGCPAARPVVFCIVPGQPHYPLYGDAAAHSWAWFRAL